MPRKKAESNLPKYIEPEHAAEAQLEGILDVLEMLARQSGVGEIKDKVEELKATLKG